MKHCILCGAVMERVPNADPVFWICRKNHERSEAAAPTVSQATVEQTTLRADARGIGPTVTPRSEYYTHKRLFPF